MKELTRERIVKEVTGYEANDGTWFKDKEECEKYEKSCKGIIMDRLYKLVIGHTTEYELYSGAGSDEFGWWIVVPKSVEDCDTITQAIRLTYDEEYPPVDYKYIGKELMVWYDPFDIAVSGFTTFENIMSNMKNVYKNHKDAYHKEA